MSYQIYLPDAAFGITPNTYDLSTDFGLNLGESAAWDINMSGEIVGQIGDIDAGEGEAFYWRLRQPICQACQLGFYNDQVLDPFSAAYAINDADPALIVGHTVTGGSPACDYHVGGFRLDFDGNCPAPSMVLLSPVGANEASYARDVNTPIEPEGDVAIVGFSHEPIGDSNCAQTLDPCLPPEVATRWLVGQTPEEGNLAELLNGGGHEARGVNNHGQIVGQGYNADEGECLLRAVYWENESTAPEILNAVPAADEARALGINNVIPAQIVGSNIVTDRAVLWEWNGEVWVAMNLEDKVDATNWVLRDAHDINDAGCIVGWGFLNGAQHAFLLYENCRADCAGAGDAVVNIVDFLAILAQWGQVGTPCDFDGGGVGITEVLTMLAQWGSCCNPSALAPPQTVADCLDRFGTEYPELLQKCLCTVEPEYCE